MTLSHNATRPHISDIILRTVSMLIPILCPAILVSMAQRWLGVYRKSTTGHDVGSIKFADMRAANDLIKKKDSITESPQIAEYSTFFCH